MQFKVLGPEGRVVKVVLVLLLKGKLDGKEPDLIRAAIQILWKTKSYVSTSISVH